MNIFYIIGNGFDIAHGYDTSYSSFYIYLKNNKEKYPEILDVCNEINSNIEAWSDFEYGFGEYIKKNGNKYSINDYKKKVVEASNALMDFLKYTTRDLKEKCFDRSVNDDNVFWPFSNCDEEDYKILRGLYGYQNTIVSVACLNFTDICSMYFDEAGVKDVINLHGRIGYNPIIGVDNLSQLKSDSIPEDYANRLSNMFAKNVLVKKALKGTNDSFKSQLNKANVIVVFGTSMGKTDETLWKMVGEKIIDGISLIYCSYGDYVGTNNVVEHVEFIDNKKKWLCQILQVDEELYGDKIFIADSKYFFRAKLNKKKEIKTITL